MRLPVEKRMIYKNEPIGFPIEKTPKMSVKNSCAQRSKNIRKRTPIYQDTTKSEGAYVCARCLHKTTKHISRAEGSTRAIPKKPLKISSRPNIARGIEYAKTRLAEPLLNASFVEATNPYTHKKRDRNTGQRLDAKMCSFFVHMYILHHDNQLGSPLGIMPYGFNATCDVK